MLLYTIQRYSRTKTPFLPTTAVPRMYLPSFFFAIYSLLVHSLSRLFMLRTLVPSFFFFTTVAERGNEGKINEFYFSFLTEFFPILTF